MMARQSASSRGTSIVMLSSTRKMRSGAAIAGIADVGDDAIDREAMKVAPAHLDDRAEAAVERAAARGLDDIDRTSHHGVAGEHAPARAGGRTSPSIQRRYRARGVALEAVGRIGTTAREWPTAIRCLRSLAEAL